MFSGIRSYIFGYSDDGESSSNNTGESVAASQASQPSSSSSSTIDVLKTFDTSNLGIETSALLEQTLTAATTKFTEKILLPSPSIEQIESSSHQLLPSLNEQHQEDEQKKARLAAELEKASEVLEDDDDCFNTDSWELLDMADKSQPESSSGLNHDKCEPSTSSAWQPSIAPLSGSVNLDKPASATGILKLADKDEHASYQRTTKLKVSFQTRELVKDIQQQQSKSDEQQQGKLRKRANRKSKLRQQTPVVGASGTAESNSVDSANVDGSIANVNNGIDSCEVAEMDESWYVTPPPCFTGSNKSNDEGKLKVRESEYENSLIENVSIYLTEKEAIVVRADRGSSSCKRVGNNANVASRSGSQVGEPSFGGSSNSSKASKELDKAKIAEKLAKIRERQIAILTKQAKKIAQVERKAEIKARTISKSKAWDNKFIVSNWNDDEQDDMIDDFDNMFEACEKPPAKIRKSYSELDVDETEETASSVSEHLEEPMVPIQPKPMSPLPMDDVDEEEDVSDSDFSSSSPALIGVTDLSASTVDSDNAGEIEFVEPADVEEDSSLNFEASSTPAESPSSLSTSLDGARGKKLSSERRAPLQVRPIEPERSPGWQLRRKRSNRRPLAQSQSLWNAGQDSRVPLANKQQLARQPAVNNMCRGRDESSSSSSARSTPSLIDRIGSSIVANLSNLASGFPAATTPLAMHQRAGQDEAENQLVGPKFNNTAANSKQVAYKSMSKANLDRQNHRAKLGGSLRRADRRKKMHSMSNGCSVDRKVHTSFH